MKTNESIGSDLKTAMNDEMSKSNVYSSGIEGVVVANEFKNAIPENENIENTKTGVSNKIINKSKIKKPIQKVSKPIMGEDKSAKSQFKKDLKKDPDYLKYSDNDNEFGVPNVTTSDPFIKKTKYKRVGKEENNESTGSGSAGGFEAPLFSTTKQQMEEECWKGYKEIGGKMKNGKMVPNCVKEGKEEYCDSCDRVKSKCVCSETKKVEATEATGSASSGSYETTSAWAKSTSKKDWRGKSKTQIPGGKFVQVKKKCKKFPYCNQGDIKALKIFENEKVKTAIQNISKRHNISENVIKSILAYEYENLISKK
jgi:hypothetical protein